MEGKIPARARNQTLVMQPTHSKVVDTLMPNKKTC